jgi:hypothetical protein
VLEDAASSLLRCVQEDEGASTALFEMGAMPKLVELVESVNEELQARHLPQLTYHGSPTMAHLPQLTYHGSPTTAHLPQLTYHGSPTMALAGARVGGEREREREGEREGRLRVRGG